MAEARKAKGNGKQVGAARKPARSAKAKRGEPAKPGKRARLRPGELDGLVLAHLREHAGGGPLTASAVAKGIGGRSSGAVSNSLDRLARSEQVRLAKKAPRAYDLEGVKAR